MIYVIFAVIAIFCTQIQSGESKILTIEHVPYVVGGLYMGYEAYKSYSNEDKKIELIQEIVNNGSDKIIKKCEDKDDERSRQIKEFLTNNLDDIEKINGQKIKTTDKEQNEIDNKEPIITGNVSKKFILNELKKQKNQKLKNALNELKLDDNNYIKTSFKVIVAGQQALLEIAQKLSLDESIASYIGKEFYGFLQQNSDKKTETVYNKAWEWGGYVFVAICFPGLAAIYVGLSYWPLFLLYEGVKNINLGFTINKKYRNGLLGLILEKYAVKK